MHNTFKLNHCCIQRKHGRLVDEILIYTIVHLLKWPFPKYFHRGFSSMPVMFSSVFYPDVSIFHCLSNKGSCVGKCFPFIPHKVLSLKNYVVNCINLMFYVYAYSKEYSQNFMNHSFSLFRLLKSYLGKHLEYKNHDFCF